MELPEDILRIIKEYAKPVTRPDWRYLHKMTLHHLYSGLDEFHYIEPDEYHYGIIIIKKIHLELTRSGFQLLEVGSAYGS
jgi:hypothetical protein